MKTTGKLWSPACVAFPFPRGTHFPHSVLFDHEMHFVPNSNIFNYFIWMSFNILNCNLFQNTTAAASLIKPSTPPWASAIATWARDSARQFKSLRLAPRNVKAAGQDLRLSEKMGLPLKCYVAADVLFLAVELVRPGHWEPGWEECCRSVRVRLKTSTDLTRRSGNVECFTLATLTFFGARGARICSAVCTFNFGNFPPVNASSAHLLLRTSSRTENGSQTIAPSDV